ncbi:hypothetical protein [Pleomorphomonas sp. PLEO]|uniref:hypothetical protein n=1 Tax=Pleomorphomonas sp. PLEO TaxID=3239306 RepID=UPI00351E956F
MSENPSLKMEVMSSPAGAIQFMRTIAERAIILRMERAATRERAIADIAKERGLGTWLKRLVYCEPVSDSASNLFKLTAALEKEISEKERRLEHDRAIVRAVQQCAPLRMAG